MLFGMVFLVIMIIILLAYSINLINMMIMDGDWTIMFGLIH